MPVLRSTVLVEAPVHTVAAALRDVGVIRTAAAQVGHRLRAPCTELLRPGDQLRFDVRILPALRLPLRTRVTRATVHRLESELVGGPVSTLRHTTVLADTAAGTLVTDAIDWRSPLGPLGRVADVLRLRRLVLDALDARAEAIKTRAEGLAAAPAVVGAALIDGDRVLAAQRAHPQELAGRWELPGGWVEPGETEPAALSRECREELGVEILIDGRLGPDVPLADGSLLRVSAARLADPSTAPEPREHRVLRWAGADEIQDLDWLDADRALLPDLVAHLEP